MKNSKQITVWLIENGFKMNKEGVELLANAVFNFHNTSKVGAMEIYEAVGKTANKDASNVERCIRHTIQTDWYKTTFKKYSAHPKPFEAIKILELVYEWDD